MTLRDLVAFSLFLGEIEAGEFHQSYLDSWLNYWVPELEGEHICKLKYPATCSRCLVEGWYKTADEIISRVKLDARH